MSKEELRKKAEQILQKKIDELTKEDFLDIKKLTHELQVREIELELQNEELRLAQLQLEEAKRKYQDLFDLAPVGYAIITFGGVIIEANNKLSEYLKVNRKSLIGSNIKDYIYPSSQDFFYFHLQKLSSQITPVADQISLLAEEREFYANIVSSSYYDENLNSKLIRIAFIDSNYSVELQKKLIESQTFIEYVLNKLPLAVLVFDKKGKLLSYNKNASYFFDKIGYEPNLSSQIFDDGLKEIFSGMYAYASERDELKILNTEKIFGIKIKENFRESKKIVESLRYFKLIFSYLYENSVNYDYLLASIADITDLKLAQDIIKENEENYKTLVNCSFSLILTVDYEGKLLFYNTQAMITLNLSEKDLGKSIFDLLNIKKLENENKIFDQVFEINNSEIIITHNAINRIYFCQVAEILFAKDKCLLVALNDVTERKTYENELKKIANEQKLINESKDKFFSIVSHDLRSPLHGMIGLTNILIEEFDTINANERLNLLMKLKNLIDSQKELLDNLLNWSKLQLNILKPELKNYPLYVIALNSVRILEKTAQIKNIQINVKIEEEINVICDFNMLGIVFHNLLYNAIKFSEPNSKIEILSSIKFDSDETIIEIRDYGKGIDEKVLTNLFSSAYSLEGTQKEKGTGLGLILCKELLEKQNGRIWAENRTTLEKIEGASFYFSIPLGCR